MVSHEGHRQRLRKRFLNEGLESFEEINVLELLLFNAIPRIDTNNLAHLLLDRFGSLENVFDAPVSELVKVKGVSINTATYLNLISSVSRYYLRKKSEPVKEEKNMRAYAERLKAHFVGIRNEMAYMLCLDNKYKEVCCVRVGEGSMGGLNIPPRKIVQQALAVNAHYVILAHNHPDGKAAASQDDISTTVRLAGLLQDMEINLLDHLIVTDSCTVSLLKQIGNFNYGRG